MKHALTLALFALAAAPLSADEALVDYVVENAAAIPAPLVAWSGDATQGRGVFERAGCADCHAAPGFDAAPNIGPALHDVGARLTAGEIRLMIVDPRIALGETDMPAYYAVGKIGEVEEALVGRTRLPASDIEALVAWLSVETGD